MSRAWRARWVQAGHSVEGLVLGLFIVFWLVSYAPIARQMEAMLPGPAWSCFCQILIPALGAFVAGCVIPNCFSVESRQEGQRSQTYP